MSSLKKPVRRTIKIDPSGEGAKTQFSTIGAPASHHAALTKAGSQPTVPSNTTGLQDTTNSHLESLTYGTLAGRLNAGEFVEYLRVWTYFDTAIPANQSVTLSLDAGGVGFPAISIPSGTAGWFASPKVTPWVDRAVNLGLSSPLSMSDVLGVGMVLVEGSAQAAFTQITQQYIEVGVSTNDHLIVERDQLQEVFGSDPFGGGRLTYDAGSGTLSASGGQLVPSDTTEKRVRWVGRTMVDGRLFAYIDPTATVTNLRYQWRFKIIDDNNYLRAGISGQNLVIEKVDGGAVTTLATVAATVGDAALRIGLRVAGNWIRVETYSDLAPPLESMRGTTQNVLEHELTGANATKFGLAVSGGVGMRIVPHATGERYDEWTFYAYKSRLVFMTDSTKSFRGTFTQYGSLVFDAFQTAGASSGNRAVMEEMANHGLDMVRLFLPFGDMMTSETVVNEAQWVAFEAFLDMCDEIGIRLDITGCETFNGPNTGQVPTWLDLADGTPVLSEANRWATFGRWWKRCGQAVAGHSSVVVCDLVNEPLAPDGQADYYIGSSIFYYGTFLCLNLSGRTKLKVLHDWMKVQRDQVRAWEPVKALGVSDIGNANSAAGQPDQGSTAALSDISLIHAYLTGNDSPQTWLSHLTNMYVPLGRPIITEESGISGGSLPWKLDVVLAWWRFIFTRYPQIVGIGGNWKNLFADSLNADEIRQFDRLEALVHGRVRRGDRAGGVDSQMARAGRSLS